MHVTLTVLGDRGQSLQTSTIKVEAFVSMSSSDPIREKI